MIDRYVLDTDAVVDLLRQRHSVAARLAAISPDDVAVTSMTAAELYYSAEASADPASNRAQVARLLGQLRVLAFGRRAAALHAELRWKMRSKPIGSSDLVIAATTLAAGATLVTANTREYARVTELPIQNWR